jgi:predicted glycosyltransferase
MARYLFSSHDGFGLGHTRRNVLVARAVLAADPQARITIVTGLPLRPGWLGDPRLAVVHVPALLKGSDGGYRHADLAVEEALHRRATAFRAAVERTRPDVVVVDRHPYGLAGELRDGLDLAARQGAAVVLGLRDVLDEPAAVRAELAGLGWSGVAQRFDEVLVYGGRVVCDHEAEYGLPVTPRYCGWVVEAAPRLRRDPRLVVITAGGGGDGEAVFRLGAAALARMPAHRALLVAGPYATRTGPDELTADPALAGRMRLVRDAPGCVEIFAGAGAVVQMAGYNATVEALAAGLRPVLVPRRSPRREQAVRAARLAHLGLADTVDEQASPEEVVWLLGRPRTLPPGAVAAAGIGLSGAQTAAAALTQLAGRSHICAPFCAAARPIECATAQNGAQMAPPEERR